MSQRRQTGQNDHWHPITDSSNIKGAGIRNGRLVIQFHKEGRITGTYQYETDEVMPPTALCCRMEMAQSKGTFVNQYIRNLPFVRLN